MSKIQKGGRLMKTMIYLDESVHRRLKYMALDERVSMAELIRRAVDEFMAKKSASRKKGGQKR